MIPNWILGMLTLSINEKKRIKKQMYALRFQFYNVKMYVLLNPMITIKLIGTITLMIKKKELKTYKTSFNSTKFNASLT